MQIPRQTDGTRKLGGSLSKRAIQSQRNDPIDDGNLSFIQKFERQKVKRMLQESKENSDGDGGVTGIGRGSESVDMSRNSKRKLRTQVAAARSTGESPSKILKRSRDEAESHADSKSDSKDLDSIERSKKRETAVRRKARNLAQKKASERLASIESTDNNPANSSLKEFKCADGLTRMPYVVLGALSLTEEAQRNVNFVVVHDFFDTYDGTAIMFKGICQRHFGCQVLCFNYPGQAYTVWPRLSPAERERGGTEPVFSNDWVADRLHELLQHVEDEGDMLLANPFHIVGIGNGANIAAAFCQRYGSTVHYANSLRSLVSINGFLHVDPQLSSILHSASQVFESTPHVRPDIPISFWSRFLFSEDYLNRVNLNLALNIYTAVANPITNEGRMKIARGALHHRDMQLGLSPDHLQVAAEQSFVVAMPIARVQVPVIVLQSTEDSLINPSNVDAYLAGRNTKHLWSHQLNMVYSAHRPDMDETTAWVGKLSTGPADYAKFSSLGKSGLKMVIDSLANPRGAFVLWSRTGHSIYQESKGVVLDLLDILALPTEDYCGLAVTEEEIRTAKNKEIEQQASEFTDLNEVQHITSKMEVLFKLAPSKSVPVELPGEETVEEAVVSTEEQGMDLDDILKEVIEVVDNEAEIRETNDSPQEFAETSQPSNNILTDEAVEPSTDRPDNEENEEEDDDQPIDGPNLASSEEAAHGQIDSHEGGDIEEALAQMEADDIPDSREEIVKEELDLEDPSTQGESNTEKDEQLEDNVAAEMDLGSKLRQIEEAAMAAADEVPPAVVDPPAKEIIASEAQRAKREWADEEKIPAVSQVIELENELARRNAEFAELQEKLETRKAQDAAETLRKFEEEQAQRRKQYEEEDRMLLERLQAELEQRRQEREMNERQRRLQLQGIEDALMHTGLIAETKNDSESVDSLPAERQPVKEMPPMTYASPGPLPAVVTESGDILGQLDSMKNDEEDARRKGILSMEEYDKMKKQVAQRQMEREEKMRHLGLGEQNDLLNDCAISIQRVIRGFVGRAVAKRAHDARELDRKASRGIITLQAIVRGAILRKKQALIKRTVMLNLQKQHGIVLIQSVFRGYLGRRFVRHLRRELSARTLQRTFRGHLGRQAANRERARLELLKKKQNAAMTIQSTWRMKVAKEEFRSLRIHMLAAIEIQRCHRGYLGRKLMKRRRKWESTPAGPERIKLGLEFIEESKLAFERQQEEIDALHRAQEKAEARVSRIHTDLKESEKELVVLQRELQEIDQIEKELQTLTHERDLLQQGVKDAVGMPRTAQRGRTDIVMGREASAEHDPEAARRRQAQAYALELTIQIKRAEREKKRQELETEFATVFQEVERKKKALERLEEALADMESTRERKDREFRRLQKNLMQLLLEQKQELDDLREKGIELETATATTAAAATATAMKAKEHEKRATAMFSQTEELMKFQMMSMSLSHLSALNMLKQFRDMNQDTTSAAIASSADAAAAAAAAATAANLPSVKKLDLGANDFIELSLQKKKAELQAAEFAEKEAKVAREQPMPDNIRMWSVSDVCRWLETLSMGQYGAAFSEALVDGQFLLDLREEDLVQVLGIKHKLHVRKILISRERLRPLNERERGLYDQTMVEEQAAEARKEIGMPDIDTVFSQARNGRIKRVEESINMGFDVNSEDERGNTLLLVAAQNSNKRLVEMLLIRGANINHQNAQGNTSLHFALRSDADGPLPEYLIEHGADDSIENIDGLTPYD
jgi:pimeloyl-ACP methyl ester carboxylesterase